MISKQSYTRLVATRCQLTQSQTECTKCWTRILFHGIQTPLLRGDWNGIQTVKIWWYSFISQPSLSRCHILIGVTVTVTRQEFSGELFKVPHDVIHNSRCSNTYTMSKYVFIFFINVGKMHYKLQVSPSSAASLPIISRNVFYYHRKFKSSDSTTWDYINHQYLYNGQNLIKMWYLTG